MAARCGGRVREDTRQEARDVNSASVQEGVSYQKDVLALPVADLDSSSRWYCEHFGMVEVERLHQPVPTVILERDGTRLGFAVNGGDPAQDGAALLVSDIRVSKMSLRQRGG